MSYIEFIPILGVISLALVAFIAYQRFKKPKMKKSLKMNVEDIPKERRPFIHYEGEDGGEGYYGEIIHRESIKGSHTLTVDDFSKGRHIEIQCNDVDNDLMVMPYADLMSGKVVFACRIDANNRPRQWNNMKLNKLKQGLSEISESRIREEAMEDVMRNMQVATDMGLLSKPRVVMEKHQQADPPGYGEN